MGGASWEKFSYLGLLHTTSLASLPYALMATIHTTCRGDVFVVVGGSGIGRSLRGPVVGLDRLVLLHLVLLRRWRGQAM